MAGGAQARNADELIGLVNAYRAAPSACAGHADSPLPPLAPHPALARVQIQTGTFLELALERAGFKAEHAEAIYLAGPLDARSAMDSIRQQYCHTLLNAKFTVIGAQRTGKQWQLVFAQPVQPVALRVLPNLQDAGATILTAVNAARAQARRCGERPFPAAPALVWNDTLARAALAHSSDMARQAYFSHTGKDGSVVGARALQAGYVWRKVGENIASGQDSADDVVAGWLASPGHCANIMHPEFTEMGTAYAFGSVEKKSRVYWTQVFGTPR
jgi:uncharacterized protein YkwD